jgi:hypothetical protein
MYSLFRCLGLTLALPAALVAQNPAVPAEKADSGPHKPSHLFRSKEPITMWLEADFKAVFKDRDTTSHKTTRFPAVLRYVGEKGDTGKLDVQLATRGSFRLQSNRGNCAFPPLKVYFNKEQTKGTMFAGDGSLKLATHCKNGERFEQNTYVEHAIYDIYNLLTPVSLKTRLAIITWINPNDPKFTVTRPGFWIQDENDMAKEVRGKILTAMGGTSSQMEPRQMALTDVFQYMIANTDFSLSYLHNYRIVQMDTSASYYPMAYDFDWAGLVDAPYANPDYRLPIRRTTDRLYRGGCHAPEVMAQVVPLFKAKKDSIYSTLRGIKGLTPARLKEAESFLDEFYKDLNDPGTVRRVFNEPCNRG